MSTTEHTATDGDGPLIIGHLNGLPDPKGLARRIHDIVTSHYEPEALRTGLGGASEQLRELQELAQALKVAQRKLNVAPLSLPMQYGCLFDGGARWREAVLAFESVVGPMLNQIAEAESTVGPHREKRGNQGPNVNLDLLIAMTSKLLRDAGSADFYAIAQRILESYGLPCPSDKTAFRRAANRGDALLEGPAQEGSVEWLRDQLSQG